LTLQPSVTQELTVVVSPPVPSHVVRFALIDGDDNGSVEDASLDLTDAATDSNGVASVRLTAPSVPTHFDVARSSERFRRRRRPVSERAGSRRSPKYFTGASAPSPVIAEVYADGTICADLGESTQGSMPPFTSGPCRTVIRSRSRTCRSAKSSPSCSAPAMPSVAAAVWTVVEGQANSVP
jgi:hypothetical protein